MGTQKEGVGDEPPMSVRKGFPEEVVIELNFDGCSSGKGESIPGSGNRLCLHTECCKGLENWCFGSHVMDISSMKTIPGYLQNMPSVFK